MYNSLDVANASPWYFINPIAIREIYFLGQQKIQQMDVSIVRTDLGSKT